MNPWDKWDTDTDETFFWFQAYRDAFPPRQLARIRVSKPGTITPPLQQLLEWYNVGKWAERAAAWDVHLDKLRQAEREDVLKKTAHDGAVRDMAIVNEARELVERELHKFLVTSMANDAETLKPNELNRILVNVIKLGRLQRGETTDNIGTGIDLSGLPLEELRRIQESLQKAKTGK